MLSHFSSQMYFYYRKPSVQTKDWNSYDIDPAPYREKLFLKFFRSKHLHVLISFMEHQDS